MEHHEAEITEIYEGVYWNEGMIDDIQPLIRTLYNKRKEVRAEGNEAMGDMYKLIMNSSYGKTLLKPSDNEIQILHKFEYKKNAEGKKEKVFVQDRLDNYLSKNFCNVMDIIETENSWECRHKKVDMDHYNLAHIGMIILDNSKKIVNRILAICNDNEVPIYYTDTDSIHMRQTDVEKLEKLFDEWAVKNNWHVKKLIGKDMLQFHCDFDSKIIKGPIWSKKFIAIGKKCYLDVLTNKKGETDYHVRFKGISRANIEYYCEQNNIDLVQFYRKIIAGDPMAIDICKGKNVVRFEYRDTHVETRSSFIKVINADRLSKEDIKKLREQC
jgi:hypothetical protein